MIRPNKIPIRACLQKATTGITIVKKLLKIQDNDKLKAEIETRAKKSYDGQDTKPLQIDMVASLAQGKNVFLLAGTGFGKIRIAEMYYDLLPSNLKPVVLVLNPLDALGDNQVEEKSGRFTAINLTKLTFTPTVAKEIKRGKYNFVYLSPEIFLNSKLWDSVYFSSKFQD
ncbi:hypothetical protein PSHT_13646 [Puccinia striiformis]|uniref:DNA 3'-5' helicase n=2 Tax=Puccinia striiformis TaxID=27350 RepID=A0A2S4UPN9_9BASI|nr:hypothetical protein PSHT_13646 [Puccinia striiformis]POW06765.1 hypothetical protein PSTT_08724 [Puccinia striiformis]